MSDQEEKQHIATWLCPTLVESSSIQPISMLHLHQCKRRFDAVLLPTEEDDLNVPTEETCLRFATWIDESGV